MKIIGHLHELQWIGRRQKSHCADNHNQLALPTINFLSELRWLSSIDRVMLVSQKRKCSSGPPVNHLIIYHITTAGVFFNRLQNAKNVTSIQKVQLNKHCNCCSSKMNKGNTNKHNFSSSTRSQMNEIILGKSNGIIISHNGHHS